MTSLGCLFLKYPASLMQVLSLPPSDAPLRASVTQCGCFPPATATALLVFGIGAGRGAFTFPAGRVAGANEPVVSSYSTAWVAGVRIDVTAPGTFEEKLREHLKKNPIGFVKC